MSDNDFSGSDAIRKAEDQGLVFSEDKKTLEECTNKKIAEVVIPNSVTKIGNSAFSGCTSLTSIVLPDSVKKIGNAAFYDCTSLTSVVIPDSVTEIGWGAFENCTGLTSVVIPDSVTEIGGGAFAGAGCEEQVKRDYPHLFE